MNPDLNYHRQTVYNNPVFHRYMDQLYGKSWRNWEYKKVKEIAKNWNYLKLYGNAENLLKTFTDLPKKEAISHNDKFDRKFLSQYQKEKARGAERISRSYKRLILIENTKSVNRLDR